MATITITLPDDASRDAIIAAFCEHGGRPENIVNPAFDRSLPPEDQPGVDPFIPNPISPEQFAVSELMKPARAVLLDYFVAQRQKAARADATAETDALIESANVSIDIG